ncbi:LVIVD repeat-containing protein [Nonomuraea sp. NPDC059194]|uniref:LVIVD repeat-containing protein n=1 Tax=Nonomuraea sp. NPDC059194 TaxID=3346764 RepID=UPI0036A240F3
MKFSKLGAAGALLVVLSACSSAPPPSQPQQAASSAVAAPPSPAAPSTGAADSDGEVMTSDNVRLVANMPREAPLDGGMNWNSDLAFQGDYAYVGNFGGFTVYDISDPTKPKTVSKVACESQQNDVSVHGNLLFLSVDEPRSDETCASKPGSRGATESSTPWEGIRIFDITDKAAPKYVSSVATDCGSHTHTMVPGKDPDTLYIYVSSPGPEPDSKTCPAPHELIQIVEVPVKDPKQAKIVASPDIFPDGQGADSFMAGCHDITAYPEKNLAAAACFGDGVLLDITDRVKPKVLQQVKDKENFQIWHSATFNNDATKVVFGDELGGGGMPTCDAKTPVTKGANAVYDIVDGKLERRGYFKMPREQTAKENCVAHNGSLIPVKGKDIMVQAWYQGGVSIWDFTDSNAPREIGYFERGPERGEPMIAGSWSAYYYNGYIYSSDILRGLDVIEINDPLTDPAKSVKMTDFNVQTQKSF